MKIARRAFAWSGLWAPLAGNFSEIKQEDDNEDLEDGEIEDDEEEEQQQLQHHHPVHDLPPPSLPPPPQPMPKFQPALESLPLMVVTQDVSAVIKAEPKSPMAMPPEVKYRKEKKNRHEKKHLTEAEKSVMRLHKIERLEREKYRRDQVCHPPIEQEEDFATSLEKAIAKVLKKEKPPSDEEKEEEVKRGKKRKKKDKHNKKKKGKVESPKSEEFDDIDMLNIRGGSPDGRERTPTLPGAFKSDEDSFDSEESLERSPEDQQQQQQQQQHQQQMQQQRMPKRKHSKRQFERNNAGRKFRDRSRERSRDREKRAKAAGKRNTGVCLYYLQGLCDDDNCQYSHEIVQPMKLELCKFYLLDCCAKGDKCLYMHSDFPCKFYHTGIPCPYGDGCKFAHGGPLTDGLKQILFKHIETAPKEILGNFPRLSRENASIMIIQAQKNLEGKFGPIKKDKDHHQQDNGGNRMDIPSLFDMSFLDQCDEMRQGDCKKENKRNRPSRWQDPEPMEKGGKGLADKQKQMNMGFGMKGGGFKDQDMRINSNGDVDMRTMPMSQPTIHPTNIVNPNILAQNPPQSGMLLPNLLPALLQQTAAGSPLQGVLNSAAGLQSLLKQGGLMHPGDVDIEKYKKEAAGMAGPGSDISMLEAAKKDTDIRQLDMVGRIAPKDSDIRQSHKNSASNDDDEMESSLQIVMEDDESKPEEMKSSILESLPRTQRELYKRIQAAQQKEKVIQDSHPDQDNDNDANIDWYSDDEDDNKLTIKDDYEEAKNDEEPRDPEPAPVAKPLEVMEKLGDLSKIDISAEVTKLLSTMSQQGLSYGEIKAEAPKDPRQMGEQRDPRLLVDSRDSRQPGGEARDPRLTADPRRTRNSSVEERANAVSIYDQGFISDGGKDVDLRSSDFADTDFRTGGRPDVDLRQLNLPFKAMQNYTPASEIDASINSHPPVVWKVCIVEIPKPDYTGLKLSATEAQTTGDPRLRKIFRLSTEEKDSPASPKESPKAAVPPTVRVDPRRKKMEAEKPAELSGMSYAQQLGMLQSSPFYQTLTSNQKLMLNQELASRNDQTGQSDPIIMAMLQSLGLVSPASQNAPGGQSQALNILANVNSLAFPQNAPMMPMGPGSQNMGQGLLGPAPNMPPDFPMGFDPRNGSMMGGGGPPFGNFPPEGNNFGGGFNDDFYPDQGSFNNNQGNNNRDNNNRGFRDRQRRGRNNNRNNRSYFRRHNRNRNSSP